MVRLLLCPSWVVLVVSIGSVACSGSDVPTASCSACAGRSYSQAECEAWGAAAGCAVTRFVPTVAGCTNGCDYEDCDTVPTCETGLPDAGGVDAGPLPPECAGQDGLFPSCEDYCPDTCNMVNINGRVAYTCPCGSCPCRFVCGSIPLDSGGVIGSVCAPP